MGSDARSSAGRCCDKRLLRLVAAKGWWLGLGLGLLALVSVLGYQLCATFISGSIGDSRETSVSAVAASEEIHVCLCSDDTDLRAVAVAIKSAHRSAAQPERLVFHFITTVSLEPVFDDLRQIHLEGINIKIHAHAGLQRSIKSWISSRCATCRPELSSPFNFAAFYLPEYLTSRSGKTKSSAPSRLIYIDTDTVVRGDLGELINIDMQGHPCAAVKTCSQTFGSFIDFSVLDELGFAQRFDPKSCSASRALMVIDVARWESLQVTSKIEKWLGAHRASSQPIWSEAMASPPWNLALNGDLLDLGEEWNCDGLGRQSMTLDESFAMQRRGFSRNVLTKLGAKLHQKSGVISPYITSCTSTAKLLHYNGNSKPWLVDKLHPKRTPPPPSCVVPENRPSEEAIIWRAGIRINCEAATFMDCADIWRSYLSAEESCAFRDADKEWADEEKVWSKNIADEAALQATEARLQIERKQQEEELERESLRKVAELAKSELVAQERSQSLLGQSDELQEKARAREEQADRERQALEEDDREEASKAASKPSRTKGGNGNKSQTWMQSFFSNSIVYSPGGEARSGVPLDADLRAPIIKPASTAELRSSRAN